MWIHTGIASTCNTPSILPRSDAPAYDHDPHIPPETTVTEIPEHLLARAKKARAERGGDNAADDAPGAEESTSPTPVAASPVVAAASSVPAESEEPKPAAPYIDAARQRKVLPVWIMPVLLFLPIWAIFYVGFLERPPSGAVGLTFVGDGVYNTLGCSGCHGANGQGGSGRQLDGGEVLLTFPDLSAQIDAGATDPFDGLAAQISWVVNGTAGTRQLLGGTFGDPARSGGQRGAGSFGNMGGFGASLSVEQLVAVVHYERVTHGLLDAAAAEAEEIALEEFILEAEAAGLTWGNQSPDQIHELLEDARSASGGA